MSQKRLRIKELILIAAKELLHENGYNRLSLRAIAQRAGFAPASLYEYFTGKDDIIDTLCMQIDESLANKCRGYRNLVDVSLAYIEFALASADDFQLLYQRALLPNQEEYVPQVFLNAAEQNVEMADAFWSTAHGLALLSLHRDLPMNHHRAILSTLMTGYQSKMSNQGIEND